MARANETGRRRAGRNGRPSARGLVLLAPAALLLLAAAPTPAPAPAQASASSGPEATPASPREWFNAGARKLGDGKLKEAEAMLETALGAQSAALQPAALYDLGHVRFAQGVEELKKGPAAKPAKDRGTTAGSHGTEAIKSADAALASNQVDQMVAAYRRGRGTRKELKDAQAAVKRALQTYGTALGKWERASGDFHGALELDPKDSDARRNAELVDQYLAKLIDSVRDMQEMANALGDQKQDLGQKLKELKGKIPADEAPPGGGGDDDEDEDQPKGPEPGEKEGPGKEGKEIPMTAEQAGWLLDGFKLDGERRLPMGQGEQADPKNRNRPTW